MSEGEGPPLNSEEFALTLSESHYVKFDESTSRLYVWNGSLTVRIFALAYNRYAAQEIDVFTLGDKGTISEAIESIESHIQEVPA